MRKQKVFPEVKKPSPPLDTACDCGKPFGAHNYYTWQCPTNCGCGYKLQKFKAKK